MKKTLWIAAALVLGACGGEKAETPAADTAAMAAPAADTAAMAAPATDSAAMAAPADSAAAATDTTKK